MSDLRPWFQRTCGNNKVFYTDSLCILSGFQRLTEKRHQVSRKTFSICSQNHVICSAWVFGFAVKFQALLLFPTHIHFILFPLGLRNLELIPGFKDSGLCVGNSSVFNMLWHSTDWIQLPLAFVVLIPLESVFSRYSERKNVSVSVQKYIRACDFIPVYPRLTAPESTNEIKWTVVTHCFIKAPVTGLRLKQCST